MIVIRHFAVLLIMPVMLTLFVGCGPQSHRVTGTVTMDGQPLEAASVMFYPVEGGRANSLATTDATGAYELKYTSTVKGAMAGEYKVLIMKVKETPGGTEIETLPARYNSKSTLTAVVTTGGKNVFDFALESK